MSAETVWEGRFLSVVKDGSWEYAVRRGDIDAAVIVALDGEDVLLVEQHRIPAGRVCLELPAGLVGDEGEDETVADAARRELEEETGYRADTVEELGEFYSSPGMTSERFTAVRATGLTMVGEAEDGITVHRVARGEVAAFVRRRRAAGIGMDAKLLILLGLGEL
ncbi:NUDIX hydrolase [Sphingomonas rubra]|uniref:GDP-mannose pyrophosphatase n=1 Tax=Sphingomonas rubra TaxID=634430 RepID=A0A1I5UD42_9SPHN|nr:NUDIX hydrolase [Sphingomonas rubra]SFP93118.1 ADP-ribose pyrophosphatase [Sphingomonas rubra]